MLRSSPGLFRSGCYVCNAVVATNFYEYPFHFYTNILLRFLTENFNTRVIKRYEKLWNEFSNHSKLTLSRIEKERFLNFYKPLFVFVGAVSISMNFTYLVIKYFVRFTMFRQAAGWKILKNPNLPSLLLLREKKILYLRINCFLFCIRLG